MTLSQKSFRSWEREGGVWHVGSKLEWTTLQAHYTGTTLASNTALLALWVPLLFLFSQGNARFS